MAFSQWSWKEPEFDRYFGLASSPLSFRAVRSRACRGEKVRGICSSAIVPAIPAFLCLRMVSRNEEVDGQDYFESAPVV